jgi:hypothetical protein
MPVASSENLAGTLFNRDIFITIAIGEAARRYYLAKEFARTELQMFFSYSKVV